MPSSDSSREDLILELARLLYCPLDRETLSISLQLLENGANPEALAALVTELQAESRKLQPM